MKLLKAISLTFLALTVSLSSAFAAEKPALDTQKKKISYSIGRQIGNNLKNSGLEIDFDVFSASIAEAMAGEKDRMTDAERLETETAIQKHQQEAAARAISENESKGKEFLVNNAKKDGVKVLPSGLQYKVVTAGTGKSPGSSDSVTVHYRGTLITGDEFDSSYKRGQPATFPVNGVIKGWTEALQLMKEGAKWQLFIPSDLAYGERGAGAKIGPNATLIFDVELVKIN